jgi:hypothetical protein
MIDAVHWFAELTAENQLKAAALVGAAIAFVIGLLQYRKAQRWKRVEWTAKEMDAFFADNKVAMALKMIDWGTRRIELYPNRTNEAERFVLLRDENVANALRNHGIQEFSEDEAAIRDVFDHFLDRLERIHSFVEAGLLSHKDVKPYLYYWAVHVIAAKAGYTKVERIVQLRRFIGTYGYVGVQKLFTALSGQCWPDDSAERIDRSMLLTCATDASCESSDENPAG